eukprot:m.349144 g.349144  ORF g.349144 m.349144 type:complete len:157 (+) comp40440_c0_seq1:238-708(+)
MDYLVQEELDDQNFDSIYQNPQEQIYRQVAYRPVERERGNLLLDFAEYPNPQAMNELPRAMDLQMFPFFLLLQEYQQEQVNQADQAEEQDDAEDHQPEEQGQGDRDGQGDKREQGDEGQQVDQEVEQAGQVNQAYQAEDRDNAGQQMQGEPEPEQR